MTRGDSDYLVLWRIVPSECNSLSEESYVLICGTKRSTINGAKKKTKHLPELHPKL